MILLFPLLAYAKSAPKIYNNILYVTDTNISYSIKDLPAVLLLVQFGDEDYKFRIRSDFLSAADSLGSRCYFAVMDGNRNMNFVRSLGHRNSQNLYLFLRYGKLVDKYYGSTETSDIVDFAMKKTGIPFSTFDDYSVAQDFIEDNENSIVLFVDKADGKVFELYKEFAELYRDNISFGLCPDLDIADEFEIMNFPTLVLFRRKDHSKVIYMDNIEEANIKDLDAWLQYNIKPKFDIFSVQNQKIYYGKQVLLFFLPVEEVAKDEALKVVLKIAVQYDSKFSINVIDAVTGNRFMTNLGFGKYADPALAILSYDSFGKMKKYLHGEEDPFTADHLIDFIEQYLSHKIKPFIRAQPLPADNNGLIKEVNSHTFVDEVINNNKDVFVLYYEDWDRIYQEFLPNYEEIAKSTALSNLEFKKFNVATNDYVTGPDPRKTPSIYLFADGLKHEPIYYKGKLHKSNLAQFIYNEFEIRIDL